MSQGVLQAIFEYQTAICELTGMDVSNASGYDGETVAADACFIAKHATGRTKIVVTEATNPQVRQVVKTYAPGFGLEVVEVPASRRHDRPGRRLRRPPRTPPPSSSSSRTSSAASSRRPTSPPRRTTPRRCAVAHVDPLSLGVLEAPGRYGCAIALGEGQAAGNLMSYGGPHYGFLAARTRVHPPHARADRRRDGRRRGQARLRPHAADARAAHPAREGDVEHHDEPDAARPRRARLPDLARPAGAARAGGDLPRRSPRYAKQRLQERRARARVSRSGNVQGVCRPRRTERARRRSATRARSASIPATRSAATTRASTTCCSSPSPRSGRRRRSTGSPRCSPRWRR